MVGQLLRVMKNRKEWFHPYSLPVKMQPGHRPAWMFITIKVYVAALRGTAILEFDLETNEYHEVITGLGRMRDVLIEEDFLYFIGNNTDGRGAPQGKDDKFYRIALSEID